MPRFAANLTLLYSEVPFEARFAAARADGFEAVECLFPYSLPAHDFRAQLEAAGLRQVLFNAPPGDWAAGERGLAALPGREAEFRRSILEQALPYADTLRCPLLHVMAGILPPGADPVAWRDTYLENLSWTATQAASHGVTLTIEPLNPVDMPGYFLQRQAEAHAIVMAVGAANLGVQMDLYHCHQVEGQLAVQLADYLPTGRVCHLQVAGYPGRHEPDVGEIDYPPLFREIDRLGYAGWIGCEYRPLAGTSQGLGWLNKLRK
ncbi:MAG: TIM barrel protein [Betaproteobacteria bacterium]|nr:TIM barrel protein [Betaproteobacteria bacterium]MDE2622503.1 TIM barrel protein [Betaproteobacteria bacterium]